MFLRISKFLLHYQILNIKNYYYTFIHKKIILWTLSITLFMIIFQLFNDNLTILQCH